MTASPPLIKQPIALFLDVDGTLLELASHPEAVVVSVSLRQSLQRLAQQQNGALALVSGRSIETLDRLFYPIRFAAAGLHGFEWRAATGELKRGLMDQALLMPARAQLDAYVTGESGVLLEDKGWTLAVHFRNAPQRESEIRRLMESIAVTLAPKFQLATGKCVLELTPTAYSKGTAIQEFMCEPPFAGRLPIFVGDDVTDEHGFEVTNALRGCSVRVGDDDARTSARYRIRGVAAVIEWLRQLGA